MASIPEQDRIKNKYPPKDPNDKTELNADNVMLIFDKMLSGEYNFDKLNVLGKIFAKGNISQGETLGNIGSGAFMIFYPRKGAFRAGVVFNNQWDDDNIGFFSFAGGSNTIASGIYSVAFGYGNIANNDSAVAFGLGNIASGEQSFAAGLQNTASGNRAVALGHQNTASGNGSVALGYQSYASSFGSVALGVDAQAEGYSSAAIGNWARANGSGSVAIGFNTRAKSLFSIAIGTYNVGFGNPTSWNNTDPILEVGIGMGEDDRRNTLTILKNGKVGIGTTTPSYRLDISDNGWDTHFRVIRPGGDNLGFIRLVPDNSNGIANQIVSGKGLALMGGNVGIGTISPSVKLEIDGQGTDPVVRIKNTGHYPSLQFIPPSNTSYARIWFTRPSDLTNRGSILYNFADDYMSFRATGVEHTLVMNSGKVGIRTTTPIERLTVAGNIGIQAGANAFIGTIDNYSLSIRTGNTDKVIISNLGYVGIGVVPSTIYMLDINGACHATSFPTSSDEKFKTDIKPIDDAFNIVINLRGVRFKWNDFYKNTLGVDCDTEKYEFGVIAQETEKVAPEVITKFKRQYKEKIDNGEEVEKEDEFLSVDYGRLVPVLIEAIKQLYQELQEVKQRMIDNNYDKKKGGK
jgi:hypothetical protein